MASRSWPGRQSSLTRGCEARGLYLLLGWSAQTGGRVSCLWGTPQCAWIGGLQLGPPSRQEGDPWAAQLCAQPRHCVVGCGGSVSLLLTQGALPAGASLILPHVWVAWFAACAASCRPCCRLCCLWPRPKMTVGLDAFHVPWTERGPCPVL